MTLLDTLAPVAPPLHRDDYGVLRVAGTRISLEHVLRLHLRGESPDEIHSAFPALDMADIHAAITYYLRNRAVVEEYLAIVEREEGEVRQRVESANSHDGFGQRVRSRRASRA